MNTSGATVLVLMGGPDAECEVSLASGAAVASAIERGGRYGVHREVIGQIGADELSAMHGDIVFPVLHGPFGEGGPLQDLLVADGRPFVGSGPGAARLAMDKLATKLAAARLGVPTGECAAFNACDEVCPIGLPAVLKRTHDGSSVGVYLCPDEPAWRAARAEAIRDQRENPGRSYLVERLMTGRELTVGVVDGRALPVIEIAPAEGFYDYKAKYQRDDTGYVMDPTLPAGVSERIRRDAERLCGAIGVRHLARVDFILDGSDTPQLLEVNSMPGFTDHSLVPKAAAFAGEPMDRLCTRLVDLAVRDAAHALTA